MALRVLLTGATGTIGGAVLETMIKKGHEVTVLVRDEGKGRLLVANNGSLCTFVVLEMKEDSGTALRRLAKGFDCVIQATYTSPEVEVVAARAFIAAGRDTAGEGARTHFVFTSDCLVYGDQGDLIITEDSPTSGCLPISEHRPNLEREILSSATPLFTTTVMRPSWVYPASGVGEYIQKAKELGLITVPKKDSVVPFVHVEDLADLYARVAEQRAGGVFNAAEPSEVRAHQLANLLSAGLQGMQIRYVDDPVAHMEEAGIFMLGMSVSQRIQCRAVPTLGWQPRSLLSILDKLF